MPGLISLMRACLFILAMQIIIFKNEHDASNMRMCGRRAGGRTDETLALGAFLNINVRRAVAVRTRPWLCGTGLAVSASFPSREGRGISGCIRAEFQCGGGFLGVAVNSTRFDEPPPPPARWGGLCEVQVPHGFGQSVEASRCSDLLA